MNIEDAKYLLNQALENLTKIQEELKVTFPEELAPDTTEEKFEGELEQALVCIENCDYYLIQVEDLELAVQTEVL